MIFYQWFVFSSIHACLLVKALLRNYVNQEKCPAELYKNTTDSVGAIANMTASLACKLSVDTRTPLTLWGP